MSRHVLLTGAAGFAGAHIAAHILENTDWSIVGLASFRHRGCPLRLTDLDPTRLRIVHCDLTAPIGDRLAEAIGPIDYIIHAAAESHVDRSLIEPRSFIENNVSVTITMLEYARLVKPKVIIQVSTDEIYGPAAQDYKHKEWEPVIPSNPYSASKACQEAIAISYWRSYGVPVVITNTMNLVGQMQDAEKFCPTVLRHVLLGDVVSIHSSRDGTVIGQRHWLHARNHADALLFLLRHHTPPMYGDGVDRPSRFHVVGDERSNLDMAELIAHAAGLPLKYATVDAHSQRPGHDLRYALSGDKISALGWSPPVPLDESIWRTVTWTLQYKEWLGLPTVQRCGSDGKILSIERVSAPV